MHAADHFKRESEPVVGDSIAFQRNQHQPADRDGHPHHVTGTVRLKQHHQHDEHWCGVHDQLPRILTQVGGETSRNRTGFRIGHGLEDADALTHVYLFPGTPADTLPVQAPQGYAIAQGYGYRGDDETCCEQSPRPVCRVKRQGEYRAERRPTDNRGVFRVCHFTCSRTDQQAGQLAGKDEYRHADDVDSAACPARIGQRGKQCDHRFR